MEITICRVCREDCDERSLCGVEHCAACTASCPHCQSELHDWWDAE